jgi:acyl-CoA synthetase (AMP-forming)/AMP-acid ligase II
MPGQAIVRIDPETEEFLRDEHGQLQRIKTGEKGILLGRISKLTPFDGYLEKQRGEGKILRNAFGDGEDWFNSGDLVQLHPWRWVSFADRLGDTYRWKGENISTVEVGNLLTSCAGIREANVYGVEVPGQDGRAGMAALVVENDFDLEKLSASLREKLPPLLWPRFLRLMPELQKTASFKYVKVPLQREGFDPSLVNDPLYLLDTATGSWVPLDKKRYQAVTAGEWRL